MKTLFAILLLAGAALAQHGTLTTYHLEQAKPWIQEQDIWASGPHCATFSFMQGIANPSLSGSSINFTLGGPTGCSYSNSLSHYSWPGISTAYAFQLDEDLYIDDPYAPQGVEFAILQRHGPLWMKFSTSCSWGQATPTGPGIWKTWSGGTNGHWNKTTQPCQRMKAGAWNHLTFNYEILNGKTHFISVTQNGSTHYLNTFGVPEIKSGNSETETTHFQMNGDKDQDIYAVWLDNITVKTTY